ncbi:MAG TPA: hypothetical protein VES38_02175 [Methylotenera sp.]|nr:hypothetical protein [Methylotenera sp.]
MWTCPKKSRHITLTFEEMWHGKNDQSAVRPLFSIILAIPIIGPFIKAIRRLIVTEISYVIGLLDGLARLFGIRITKHLRVHMIPLCEGSIPLVPITFSGGNHSE